MRVKLSYWTFGVRNGMSAQRHAPIVSYFDASEAFLLNLLSRDHFGEKMVGPGGQSKNHPNTTNIKTKTLEN